MYARSGAEKTDNAGRAAEGGVAMVEFALVFMLLFTVVTLIVQGGFFFGAWLAVTNGAREGARFGAPCLNRDVPGHPEMTCDEATVEDVARERVADVLKLSPTPVVAAEKDPDGDYVTVTVTGRVSSVGPIPLDLPVYGVSRMRLEARPTPTP